MVVLLHNVWLDVLFITEYLTASPASKGLLKRGAADPGSAQGDPGV